MKTDTYKVALEAEKAQLESELSHDAVPNPENPSDWDTVGSDMNQRSADPNELADNIEEDLRNDAIVSNLESRLIDVNEALLRIEEGKYGLCEECGGDIEEGRLEANPAARTCVAHMEA